MKGYKSERLLLLDHDKVIPFTGASSGIQSVIPLLMVIDYMTKEYPHEHFVVEEPELNLCPQTQVDLLHYMVSKCHSLTVTTHSPYLLEEVVALIPKECILDFDSVTAYKIQDGNVVSILDEEYHIIVADQIDAISDKNSTVKKTS